jgi:hypothetical protein
MKKELSRRVQVLSFDDGQNALKKEGGGFPPTVLGNSGTTICRATLCHHTKVPPLVPHIEYTTGIPA